MTDPKLESQKQCAYVISGQSFASFGIPGNQSSLISTFHRAAITLDAHPMLRWRCRWLQIEVTLSIDLLSSIMVIELHHLRKDTLRHSETL
jgi:hypothetical protein